MSVAFCSKRGQIASGTCLLTLCEVALGTMYQIKPSKSGSELPEGTKSIKLIGRTFPDPAAVVSKDGVIIPMGQPREHTNAAVYFSEYNEYIVYDESQVKMKYLVRVKVAQKSPA